MTRDVCLVWNSIINGADFDKPGPGQKLDEEINKKIHDFVKILAEKKIITRNREELKLKKPCRDRLKSITAGAVFSIEFEDGF